MQTFLAYPYFNESASVLDDKRLGKQRVECLQILNVLAIGPYQRAKCDADAIFPVWESCPVNEWQKDKINYEYRRTPWYNHPAVRMWKGYEAALNEYARVICLKWRRRGYKDTVLEKLAPDAIVFFYPPWLGNLAFHASHRSNLLRKNAEHYSQFGWTEPHNLPYVWPV